ncbi:hypothetical protein GCM10025777_60580 [Membranihabitans marinus]
MKQQHLIFILFVIFSCSLEKEIEIDLPDFENGYVVEAYLQPNQSFEMLITRTYPFYEVFDSNLFKVENINELLVNNVEGILKVNGTSYVIDNKLIFKPDNFVIHNYTTSNNITFKEGDTISIELTFEDGTEIEAHTYIPSITPIDSVVLICNEENIGRELTYITTDSTSVQYYRRIIGKRNESKTYTFQDFPFDNDLSDGGKMVFGSGYDYYPKDTLYSRIIHITEDYYLFLQSVNGNISANIQPLSQPGKIYSNVNGSDKVTGIFTGLAKSEVVKIISEK